MVFGPDDDADEKSPTSILGDARRESAAFFVAAINKAATAIPDFYSRTVTIGRAPAARLLWAQSMVKEKEVEKVIDFTNAASVRASDLILAVAYMQVIRSRSDVYGNPKFEKLWTEIDAAVAGSPVYLKLKQAVDRMAKEAGFGGRLAAIQEPPIVDEVAKCNFAREEVKCRMHALWDAIGK